MSHVFRFSDALGYSLAQLTEMHNESFTGYFFPATMTPDVVADFWRVYQVDARACVVMQAADGAFAGLARVGVRGERAWCGGFGVAPAFRGMGASHLLAAQMIAVARERGLATLQLEVLTQNAAAIKTYTRAGFTTSRRLVGLELESDNLPPGDATPAQPVSLATLLPTLLRQARPDWEREVPTMLARASQAVTVTHADGTSSGIIYWHSRESAHILAADLAPPLSPATFVALLRAIAGPKRKIYLTNEPEDTRLYALGVAIGFTTFYSQHEMFVTL